MDLYNFLAKLKVISADTLQDFGLSHEKTISVLKELTQKGVLQPFIRVVCPYCGSEVGVFDSPEDVPSKTEICECCLNEVDLTRKEGWILLFRVDLSKIQK